MENSTNKTTDNSDTAGMKQKLSAGEARIVSLEAENKALREEIAGLRSKKPESESAPEFAEASGVLWKRKRSGGYESVPCCPTCKSTLSDYSGSLLCLKCNWQAPLKSFEVPKVFHDLFGQS
jgi:hypothetical protein